MSASPQVVLGFDYGARRIGVAVGQNLTGTATGLVTLHNGPHGPDWDALDKLISQWRPAALLVGMPLNMDGTAHAMTRASSSFAELLGQRYGLPVHRVDERLSSIEAQQRLNATGRATRRPSRAGKEAAKGALDRAAAQVIVQSWFADQARPSFSSETTPS